VAFWIAPRSAASFRRSNDFEIATARSGCASRQIEQLMLPLACE